MLNKFILRSHMHRMFSWSTDLIRSVLMQFLCSHAINLVDCKMFKTLCVNCPAGTFMPSWFWISWRDLPHCSKVIYGYICLYFCLEILGLGEQKMDLAGNSWSKKDSQSLGFIQGLDQSVCPLLHWAAGIPVLTFSLVLFCWWHSCRNSISCSWNPYLD